MANPVRPIATAVLALGLCACNQVVSIEPWFSASDANAPRLRDGLWLAVENPDCRVEVAKPAERWPDCAQALVVRGQEWLSMEWDEEPGRRRTFAGWASFWVVMADGDPVMTQYGATPTDTRASPSAAADEPSDDEVWWNYYYGAMRPVRSDDAGSVVELVSWGVACGPFPEEPDEEDQDGEAVRRARYVTDRPFPGLTVRDDNCTAESVAALRQAARLSEGLGPPRQMRWIREGWR